MLLLWLYVTLLLLVVTQYCYSTEEEYYCCWGNVMTYYEQKHCYYCIDGRWLIVVRTLCDGKVVIVLFRYWWQLEVTGVVVWAVEVVLLETLLWWVLCEVVLMVGWLMILYCVIIHLLQYDDDKWWWFIIIVMIKFRSIDVTLFFDDDAIILLKPDKYSWCTLWRWVHCWLYDDVTDCWRLYCWKSDIVVLVDVLLLSRYYWKVMSLMR